MWTMWPASAGALWWCAAAHLRYSVDRRTICSALEGVRDHMRYVATFLDKWAGGGP